MVIILLRSGEAPSKGEARPDPALSLPSAQWFPAAPACEPWDPNRKEQSARPRQSGEILPGEGMLPSACSSGRTCSANVLRPLLLESTRQSLGRRTFHPLPDRLNSRGGCAGLESRGNMPEEAALD